MKNEPKRVAWPTFRSGVADALDGEIVELSGWRYQLVDAELVATPRTGVSRRAFLASGAALGLVACAPECFANYTDDAHQDASDTAWRTPSMEGNYRRVFEANVG